MDERIRSWLSYKLFRLSMRLHPSHARVAKYMSQVWTDMAISGGSLQRIDPEKIFKA